ncbi:hypothetical protein DCC81_22685 [Chitinophaga parva]|uniref:Uncharacterized protein n=1 Tax=Chitinophaga parva TaxID=2169414 RepID=A0A2T7BDQ0_9BACT|nr:hypothetical protein DCC81_22685 [Chitinophaga parva]
MPYKVPALLFGAMPQNAQAQAYGSKRSQDGILFPIQSQKSPGIYSKKQTPGPFLLKSTYL